MRISRLLAMSLALIATVGLVGAVGSRAFQRTPERAFELTFRGEVPDGVTDLRVVGRCWSPCKGAWMRFRAPQAIIDSLCSRSFEPGPYDERKPLRTWQLKWELPLRWHDPQDRLRWRELYTARRLETFHRRAYQDAQMWVDRETNTVYLYCFGNQDFQ